MGDYAPLGITLAFLMFVGIFFPFVLGFIVDVDSIQLSPLTNSLVDLVNEEVYFSVIPFVDWDDININPFSWLGSTMQGYLTISITYLGLLPDFVVIIVIIMSVVSIIYSIIKLFPGT